MESLLGSVLVYFFIFANRNYMDFENIVTTDDNLKVLWQSQINKTRKENMEKRKLIKDVAYFK